MYNHDLLSALLGMFYISILYVFFADSWVILVLAICGTL